MRIRNLWPMWLVLFFVVVSLGGCSSGGGASGSQGLYEFSEQIPEELSGLERLKWIAKKVDLEAEVPDPAGFTMRYSTGVSHHLSVLPLTGKLESPPDANKLEPWKDGKKHYRQYFVANDKLAILADNADGQLTLDTKIIYHQNRLLGAIIYHEGKPSVIRLLDWGGDKATHLASFPIGEENGATVIRSEKSKLSEIDTQSWDAYQSYINP